MVSLLLELVVSDDPLAVVSVEPLSVLDLLQNNQSKKCSKNS
jgi:hypothetical protein